MLAQMLERRNPVHAAALKVVLPYVLLAGLWLLVSDRVVSLVSQTVPAGHWMQTAKGLGFVLVTAALLHALCYRRFSAIMRAHRDLRESQRRFDALAENLPGMAYQCLADECWTMLFVSGTGAQSLTGYLAEEIVDNAAVRYEELIHPEDRASVREAVGLAIERRTPFRLEYRIITADGSTRWVWEQGVPVYDASGRLSTLEGYIMDVTDRKAVEQVERERARLEDDQRAVEEAIGAIGHELRTPLASQRLLVEAILEGDCEGEEGEQYLRAILGETARLTDLATNMLESARSRGGGAAWNWGEVHLAGVLDSALEIIRPLARQGRVELSSSVTPEDLAIRGDADAIQRLVLNLLSNACRHAPSGEVSLAATLDEDGRSVRLVVGDNGRGMSPDVLARLGQAFALSNGCVASDPAAGVGLGLAICRRIVAVHGGRLTVSSQRGRGTVFVASLPVDLGAPRASAEPEPIALAA